MSKVFISHGDIILDNIYNGDLELIKQDGGGSNWNTLYNLSYLGETCYAVGTCGKDKEGDIALSSLKSGNVNTDLVRRDDISTSIMNIIIPNQSELGDNSIIHSWYSPITNKRTLFFRDNLPIELSKNILEHDIYVLLDKFETINFDFISNLPKKKVCLDIGHVRFIEHFTKQYLTMFFKTANLIQLNETVKPLLFERLQIQNEFEFFNLLDLDLLVVTKGKKGATFIFKENNELKTIDKEPEVIAKVIDSSGAGDAFFASVIQGYAYTDIINSNFINKIFSTANKASRTVISQLGSRRTS